MPRGDAAFATRAVELGLRPRALRALGVAGVWAAAVLPALVGWQQCGFARYFHAPCPGCGMTRAAALLLAGDWRGSLAMHPLAVPAGLAGASFALATVWATYVHGAPLVQRTATGRAALAALALVYVATFALWVLRWLGYFGGPVAVF